MFSIQNVWNLRGFSRDKDASERNGSYTRVQSSHTAERNVSSEGPEFHSFCLNGVLPENLVDLKDDYAKQTIRGGETGFNNHVVLKFLKMEFHKRVPNCGLTVVGLIT
ncbi:hypothetical protein R1flu_018865 [Riccia fluitans]|uniref:Uncharacterized protein n=1 Tax=Riccia fluitans TaxID=41844 RepID=A0ABD1ZI36_9MARC